MTPVRQLHRILYFALLDIRSCSLQHGDKAAFSLADLFHSVVMKMADAAEGDSSYDEVLEYLGEVADNRGYREWLHSTLSQIDGSAPRPGREKSELE